MVIYRCKICGYLHLGEIPETCPMCGGPGSNFYEYKVPDISGTKTYENLEKAFTGESQALPEYTLWKQVAQIEGHPEAAEAFDRPLREEPVHALSHAIYMGRYGSTAENVANSVSGEKYEETEMYPEMAKTAEEEGFPEIAHYLRSVAKFEGIHKNGFIQAEGQLR